jgi:chromosome segregation ATPase
MEFFQKKTTQIIGLVTIIGTLAGFGYTGATYVNRLENLEKKIGGIAETEDSTAALENRFVAIETSIEFINRSIDEGLVIEVREIQGQVNTMAVNISALQTKSESLEKQVDKLEDADSNPLLN